MGNNLQKHLVSILFLLIFCCNQTIAQEENKNHWIQNFSGSIESNTQLYQKDSLTNAVVPEGKIGSHNFVTLKYAHKGFSAGVQLEAYLPSLQGYAFNLRGAKFTNNFISFKQENYGITLGDFYEQFGNGSLLRAYENRAIGINNAIKGVNVFVKPLNNITFKALYGYQRVNFEKSEGKILAADIDWQMLGNQADDTNFLSIAASIVNRYEPYFGILTTVPESTTGYEIRAKYSTDKVSTELSYTHKGYDPNFANLDITNSGSLIYLNTSYTHTGLSVQWQMRRMENIDFRTDRKASATNLPINYNAPLTKPSDFNLVNIYVYPPQLISEMATQFDATYTFAEGTKIGGAYGSTLSFNAAFANNLDITNFSGSSFESNLFGIGEKYFHDVNINFTKKISQRFKGSFVYHNIFFNPNLQTGSSFFESVKANIFIHQGKYNIAKGKAFRYELQHLFTEQDKKNWASIQLEYELAPHYSFFVGDMFNYGNKIPIHYYNVGASFTYQKSKIIINYARQREGLICVGGVCRNVPASTGLNVSLLSRF
jgi:hypothetical protein